MLKGFGIDLPIKGGMLYFYQEIIENLIMGVCNKCHDTVIFNVWLQFFKK